MQNGLSGVENDAKDVSTYRPHKVCFFCKAFEKKPPLALLYGQAVRKHHLVTRKEEDWDSIPVFMQGIASGLPHSLAAEYSFGLT